LYIVYIERSVFYCTFSFVFSDVTFYIHDLVKITLKTHVCLPAVLGTASAYSCK